MLKSLISKKLLRLFNDPLFYVIWDKWFPLINYHINGVLKFRDYVLWTGEQYLEAIKYYVYFKEQCAIAHYFILFRLCTHEYICFVHLAVETHPEYTSTAREYYMHTILCIALFQTTRYRVLFSVLCCKIVINQFDTIQRD